MKLKKLKATFIAAMVAMATLITTVPVYAAQVSSESTEIRENKEKSTVFVFGSSIVMTYDNGTIEIIPNNPSGRVDVMIAGKLYKGMGKVTIAAQKEKVLPNMVLEKNSFFVKGVTEQTAAAISEKAKQAILANNTVSSLSDVRDLENADILHINNEGNLETSDGKIVAADKAGVSLTTVEKAYTTHTEALKEAAANEQKEEATLIVDGNLAIKQPEINVTPDGQCRHLRMYNSDKWRNVGGEYKDGRFIYTYVSKWSFCPDCYKSFWNEADKFQHEHKYEYEQTVESVETYEYEGKVTSCNVTLLGKCECYYHGPLDSSTGRIYKNIYHDTDLKDGEYCKYCGYNKDGQKEAENNSSDTSTSQAENENTDSDTGSEPSGNEE